MSGELTQEQHKAILAARRALFHSLEKRYPPRLAGVLTCVAISGAFSDLVAASSGRDDLIAVINAELARVGLMLTETARH